MAHLHPVAGGAAHVIEHREDAFLYASEALRISDAVDFEELPGLRQRMLRRLALVAHRAQRPAALALYMQYRVRNEMNRESRLVDRNAHRVDEKRHVLGGHDDEGMGTCEAVARWVGIEHPHQRLSRTSLSAEIEVVKGSTR